jgi:hypothetical protein
LTHLGGEYNVELNLSGAACRFTLSQLGQPIPTMNKNERKLWLFKATAGISIALICICAASHWANHKKPSVIYAAIWCMMDIGMAWLVSVLLFHIVRAHIPAKSFFMTNAGKITQVWKEDAWIPNYIYELTTNDLYHQSYKTEWVMLDHDLMILIPGSDGKIRSLKYHIEFFTFESPEAAAAKILYIQNLKQKQVWDIKGLVEYLNCEFTEKHRNELVGFYNPKSDAQQVSFRKLVNSFLLEFLGTPQFLTSGPGSRFSI